MSLLLGLVVAASFGSGDFLGGLASTRDDGRGARHRAGVRAGRAVVVAVIVGGDPQASDFALGALGGVLNVAALGCLYQGLAVGRVGVVAPIAAVVGSVIPVVWGLATGENPATPRWSGSRWPSSPAADLGRAAPSTRPPTRAAGRRSLLAVAGRRGLRVLVRLLRQRRATRRSSGRCSRAGSARCSRSSSSPRSSASAPALHGTGPECRPSPPDCST